MKKKRRRKGVGLGYAKRRERGGGYIDDETNIVVRQAVHDDVLGEVGNSDGIGDGGTEGGRVVVTGRRHGGILVEEDAHRVVWLD